MIYLPALATEMGMVQTGKEGRTLSVSSLSMWDCMVNDMNNHETWILCHFSQHYWLIVNTGMYGDSAPSSWILPSNDRTSLMSNQMPTLILHLLTRHGENRVFIGAGWVEKLPRVTCKWQGITEIMTKEFFLSYLLMWGHTCQLHSCISQFFKINK